MAKKWHCIEVIVPEEDAEALAFDVAELLGLGVEMTAEGFRYYVDPETERSSTEDAVGRLLASYGDRNPEKAPAVTLRRSTLEEDDWADRWKVHFKPMRVGRQFVICPTWEVLQPAEGDRVIVMDPGRAFGTGHHETTRLCLEWLEDCSRGHRLDAMSLLDLGTGSGILAMAAALLGFDGVVALDIDEEAVEVARENLVVNGLEARVLLMVGSLPELAQRFHVVVANIQASPLMAMAQPLAEHLHPGGMLVLSGILIEQEPKVRATFELEGLALVERRIDGEWCLLAFKRDK
ncbi:MAG: 50S ribosomal protein L11 methyltransferase [Syntrophobacteraceae bacterium]|jgi:ribosomal protein L11 methyltransferase|nr:50S ribosomal protein L11 methyltransferase [Syntrophobacteraceae bacterium]